eukprot:6790819-Lingulodinium_polyedra.AAC.1
MPPRGRPADDRDPEGTDGSEEAREPELRPLEEPSGGDPPDTVPPGAVLSGGTPGGAEPPRPPASFRADRQRAEDTPL